MEISRNAEARAAVENIQQVYRILKGYGFRTISALIWAWFKVLIFIQVSYSGGLQGIWVIPYAVEDGMTCLFPNMDAIWPAMGFAVGIKRLLIAMEQQGCLEEIPGLMFY